MSGDTLCKRTLVGDIAAAINYHSAENESDTPDFVLAEFLVGCLGLIHIFQSQLI